MYKKMKFILVTAFLLTCTLTAQTEYTLLSEQVAFTIPDNWQINVDPEKLTIQAVNASGSITVTIWEIPADFESILLTHGESIAFDYEIADFGDYNITEISALTAAISDLKGINNTDYQEYRIISVIYSLEEYLTVTFKAEISSNATAKEIKEAEKIAYTIKNLK